MPVPVFLLFVAFAAAAGPTTGITPLSTLGAGIYLGFEGGLYPGGANLVPPGHFADALAAAAAVVPRDASGAPSADGLVGFVSVGMSNTTQEFKVFERDQDRNPRRSARVVLVNGAVPGQSSQQWRDPAHPVWTTLAQRLQASGLSPAQVQVVWLKQAQAAPATTAFPQHALDLEDDLRAIARNLRDRFPNAALCYLSSRIYGGWTDRVDRGEPLSFETGFAAKWLIEDQIAGDPALNFDPARGPVEAPLLLWGPYLWADGESPREDGLTWLREDFVADAIHPSPSGEQKVGDLLSRFFEVDETARPWWRQDASTDLVPLDAAADASVDQASPAVNGGSLTYLRTVGPPAVGRAFMKFDASSVATSIVHAKLSLLPITEGSGALRSALDTSWSETAITWANAPPLDPAPLGPIPSWSNDGSMSHDVTAYLAADADRVVTLAIDGTDGNVRRWQSRETGEGPRLVLTVATTRITIRLEKDSASGGVALSWNDTGAVPYTVRRAVGPTPADFATSLDRSAAGTSFTDPGVLSDPQSYWYLVE